jgi:hypothetical protein
MILLPKVSGSGSLLRWLEAFVLVGGGGRQGSARTRIPEAVGRPAPKRIASRVRQVRKLRHRWFPFPPSPCHSVVSPERPGQQRVRLEDEDRRRGRRRSPPSLAAVRHQYDPQRRHTSCPAGLARSGKKRAMRRFFLWQESIWRNSKRSFDKSASIIGCSSNKLPRTSPRQDPFLGCGTKRFANEFSFTSKSTAPATFHLKSPTSSASCF